MKIINIINQKNLATVYIGETSKGRVEFVESIQPPLKKEEKWVIIISTLYGCPIACKMCDAGDSYKGKISKDDMLAQINHIISENFPSNHIPVKKFKIQFARMGEPSLNNAVLEVLSALPELYNAPNLIPALSTIAPKGTEAFFQRLLEIKKSLYKRSFQIQFSIHSTDENIRNNIMPVNKWSLREIANYGEAFFDKGGRKTTLNFILAKEFKIDINQLVKHFNPEYFLIKTTPLNPTFKAHENSLNSSFDQDHLFTNKEPQIVTALKNEGFDVIVSIGDMDENLIGSNCGQYIKAFEEGTKQGLKLENAYTI